MEFEFSTIKGGPRLALSGCSLCHAKAAHGSHAACCSPFTASLAGVPADVFRLRHDVYCVERAFLDPAQFCCGMELDCYDEAATHFAAHTLDGSLVGTVRLVAPSAGLPYPFELHCRTFDGFRLPPRPLCAEVSRLVVRRSHRRRFAGCTKGAPGFAAASSDQAVSPMLLLGMYRHMLRHSRGHGVRYWIAAMERSLARALRTMGFCFDSIGPATNYYGNVSPYMVDLHVLRSRLATDNPSLGAWFDEPLPG